MPDKLTLQDVARSVGVSASTISRVLNGVAGVNEGTRRKVLSAVRQMNYSAGVVGRQAGHSRLIGLLMPAEAEQWGVRTNFTEEGLQAINDVAAASNYAAMVGSYQPVLGGKAEDEMIRRGDFAGVLLFRTRDELRDSEPFRRHNIPFLVVNRLLPDTSLNYIGPDHLQAGFTAAGYLLAGGHRRIGLLLGSDRYISHRLYLQGFQNALCAAGIPADPELLAGIELNPEGGYSATRALMELPDPPEALIVTGDRASLGCLKALRDLKKKVPRDVAVVAIDGTRETAFADPPLTAVEIPWYDMLALGTRLLMDLIRHRPPIEQIGVRYSTRLIVRQSTRAPVEEAPGDEKLLRSLPETPVTSAPTPRSLQQAYRPWQVRIFISTWLAYAGYYFCRKPFYVVKADMAGALGFSPLQLGHLGTAYLAAYSVGQFSSAYFGRKLGPKLLLIAGIAISIGCNFVFGAANSYWTILLFLSLNGLAQGTGWPGCIGSLAFWFRRDQRGSVLGVWSTCYQAGSFLATGFAAWLLGRAGWRWSFFGCALLLLAIWAVVLLLHPDRPETVGLPPVEDDDEPKPAVPAALQETNGFGWTLDTSITVFIMGVIYFTIKFLRYALWSWAPFFLHQNFGLAGDKAGYLSTVFEACGFLSVILSGFLTDKLFHGRRAFVSFAMLAMMTLSFVLMATLGAHSVFFFTLAMGLAGLMLFGPDSLLSGAGAIDVGSRRGALAAAGIINGMGSIGPIFQEEIIGRMYKGAGQQLTPILQMLVWMAAAGTAVTFLLWMRARQGKANI